MRSHRCRHGAQNLPEVCFSGPQPTTENCPAGAKDHDRGRPGSLHALGVQVIELDQRGALAIRPDNDIPLLRGHIPEGGKHAAAQGNDRLFRPEAAFLALQIGKRHVANVNADACQRVEHLLCLGRVRHSLPC
jgi:hypothetical protein